MFCFEIAGLIHGCLILLMESIILYGYTFALQGSELGPGTTIGECSSEL